MRTRDIIGLGAALGLVWLLQLLLPHILSPSGALLLSAALAGYPVGLHFHKRRSARLPAMVAGSGQDVFPVRRRGILWSGYAALVLGPAAFAMVWFQQSSEPGLLLAAPAALVAGVVCILMARNVREIRVDDHSIRFLPVGASLPLDEISAIKTPVRDSAPTHIELATKSTASRYVPGALLQWNGGCRLTVTGSNGDAVLSALRRRLPSA